ncbi:hypothetical protein [Streptomyces muensis]|uniref:Uncharacterized protein n=1 Tax=Streptomyces muensis TaxID=1077944 RepID=A0A9X1PT29_STRM4|nr:hypothetical protein [Streptomyces muensis]MCF1592583.1 hypothetical protein [Streptomyces muensis]
MSYADYVTGSAQRNSPGNDTGHSASWDCKVGRVTEIASGIVVLELEERSDVAGHPIVFDSLSTFTLDAARKIERIDIYMKMDNEMIRIFAGFPSLTAQPAD